MKNLNNSSVKASDMVSEVYVGPISAQLFLAIFLSNSDRILLTGYYREKCIKA